MKLLGKLIAAACLGTLLAAPGGAASPEETFRKSFPQIPLETIRPTEINGVYEIISGGRIAYYAPGPEYLITGSLVTRDGRNLTDERFREIMGQRMKELPLEKAVKIGAGPHKVIEVTDPDCAYCRKASAYLAGRKDVTRYIFFHALAIHPEAAAKVKYILCAKDRVKAYEEAMTGKLDGVKLKPCQDASAEETAKSHSDLMNKLGISATPLFLIDGTVVAGADIGLMEKLLGPKK